MFKRNIKIECFIVLKIYYDSEKLKYCEILQKTDLKFSYKEWYRENFAQDFAVVFYQECTVG